MEQSPGSGAQAEPNPFWSDAVQQEFRRAQSGAASRASSELSAQSLEPNYDQMEGGDEATEVTNNDLQRSGMAQAEAGEVGPSAREPAVDMAGVAAERVVQFRENEQSSAEELIPDYSRLGAPTGASAAGEQAVADDRQSDMEARVASMAAESPVLGMNFPMQHQGVQIDTQALGALMSQLMQVQMAPVLDRVLEATSSLSQRLDKLESSYCGSGPPRFCMPPKTLTRFWAWDPCMAL